MKQLIWSSLLALTILALGSACSKKGSDGGGGNSQPYRYQGSCDRDYAPGYNYNHNNQQNGQYANTPNNQNYQNQQYGYQQNQYSYPRGRAQYCVPNQMMQQYGYGFYYRYSYGVMTCDMRLPGRLCPNNYRCASQFGPIGICVSNYYY